jgi:anthranilate synthase component 2
MVCFDGTTKVPLPNEGNTERVPSSHHTDGGFSRITIATASKVLCNPDTIPTPPPPPPPHEKQYLGDLGCEHVVFKNDEKTVEEIAAMNPRGVMVSPGPGKPEDSGISLEAVRVLGPQFGVFGVCMGHQCIGQVFGGDVIRAPCGLMHGKASPVWHTEDSSTMLSGLPSPFQAARYHSLVISRENFPNDELEITAWTEDETIMAVKHRKFPKIQGVQFHPESIITESGLTIIANWVKLINEE